MNDERNGEMNDGPLEMPSSGSLVREESRDPAVFKAQLEQWFAQRLDGSNPVVSAVKVPEGTGMSSDTILFEAELTNPDGRRQNHSLVARLAPDPEAVPLFPTYDLAAQFEVMMLVGDRTDVPVPTPRWSEPDPTHLGTPFIVMDRIDGLVPPDMLPYNFGSWLSEADPADQRRLQDATVSAIASIHTITPENADLSFLAQRGSTEASALRRHVSATRSYYEWATGDTPHPVIERAFEWLEANWPKVESAPVLSWGDSRIGNVIYRDFTPVAVLDWEMASVAPPEVDLGWIIFMHRFFEDIAHDAELEGMNSFLRADDVCATYQSLTNHAVSDLNFMVVYAALRHAIIMSRVHRRMVLVAGGDLPVDPDDMIIHRRPLEAMLDGSYWSKL